MRDYYGWRARIGLIYPAACCVMEPELYAMAPEGYPSTPRGSRSPVRPWTGFPT